MIKWLGSAGFPISMCPLLASHLSSRRFGQIPAGGEQTRQPWRQPGLDKDLRALLQGHHLHRPGRSREVPEDHRVWHDRTPARLLYAHGEITELRETFIGGRWRGGGRERENEPGGNQEARRENGE